MAENNKIITKEDGNKLAKFVYSDELANLEDKINSNFNIFLTLGMGNLEIKHSNFLAWLFNPKEKHGLGDFFVKNFLKLTLKDISGCKNNNGLSLFDVDRMNFSNLIVKREWNNIDILLEDNVNKFVCVIENKIYASQGDRQLKKYAQIINSECKDYKDYKKLFLYLKPVNDEMLNDENYHYVSYDIVYEVLEKILNKKNIILNNEIEICIKHYKELLETRIMENGSLKKLCMDVYTAHKDAINLLIDNIDFSIAQTKIAEVIRYTIGKDQRFVLLEKGGSRNIYFIPEGLDKANGFSYAVSNPAGIREDYNFRLWLDGKAINETRQNIQKCLKGKYKILGKEYKQICQDIENGDESKLEEIKQAFQEKLNELANLNL